MSEVILKAAEKDHALTLEGVKERPGIITKKSLAKSKPFTKETGIFNSGDDYTKFLHEEFMARFPSILRNNLAHNTGLAEGIVPNFGRRFVFDADYAANKWGLSLSEKKFKEKKNEIIEYFASQNSISKVITGPPGVGKSTKALNEEF